MKETLENIGERLRSPFFFSFIVSWLAINWKVTLALFYYNNSELTEYQNMDIIGLVMANRNIYKFFICPFSSSLIYTFGYPYFKNLITAARAWYERQGERWREGIMKRSMVAGDLYLKLQKDYKAKRDELIALLNDTGTLTEENKALKDQIGGLNSNIETFRKITKRLEDSTSTKTIEGNWKMIITTDAGDKHVYFIRIINGTMDLILERNTMKTLWEIRSLVYEESHSTVSFVKYYRMGNEIGAHYYVNNAVLYNELKINPDFSVMEGEENAHTSIRYERT